jgi:hypothetical protein
MSGKGSIVPTGNKDIQSQILVLLLGMLPLERWNLGLDERREQQEKALREDADAETKQKRLDTTNWRMLVILKEL